MTTTELANKAIREALGVPRIDSIDSTSNSVAIDAKAAYDTTRQLYLRMADPGFARREVLLALSSGETSVKYDYVYGHPSNSLQLREIWNGTTNEDPRIEYEEGAHSSGTSKVILSNEATPTIFYTIDITDLNEYNADDIHALALLWAVNIAMPVTRDVQLRDRMKNEYLVALAVAKTNNRRGQFKELPTHDKYITARA